MTAFSQSLQGLHNQEPSSLCLGSNLLVALRATNSCFSASPNSNLWASSQDVFLCILLRIPFCTLVGKCPQAESWGNDRVHLVCSLFLRDRTPVLRVFHCLKILVSHSTSSLQLFIMEGWVWSQFPQSGRSRSSWPIFLVSFPLIPSLLPSVPDTRTASTSCFLMPLSLGNTGFLLPWPKLVNFCFLHDSAKPLISLGNLTCLLPHFPF